MYIIYRHQNTLTGKSYIGFSSNSIDYRLSQHIDESMRKTTTNRAFLSALKKYPLEHWVSEVVASTEDLTHAKELEKYYIQLYQSHVDQNGYNMTIGGDGFVGGHHSSESKAKTSLKMRDKEKNYKNGRKDKNLSKEHLLALKKPRSHYKRISEKDYKWIQENQNKFSYSEMAKCLDTDIATIKRWLSRSTYSHKIPNRLSRRALTYEQYLYIQTNKGTKTLKSIAQDLTLTCDLVKKWAKLKW